jgi:DNA repair protein RadC
MAPSAKAEADRQLSVLADLVAVVAPADARRIAASLLAEFQTIGRLWSQTREAIDRILGSGSEVTGLLLHSRKLALAALSAGLQGMRIDPGSSALRDYLILGMGSLPDEQLRVLFLDAGQHLIADEQLQYGTLTRLALYPRTIFRRALELNAAGIILVHNHPSRDPRPSEHDIEVTRQLDRVGAALDIKLVDHIIVAESGTHHIRTSGAKRGLPRISLPLLRSPDPAAAESDVALENAKATLRRRMLRDQLFGAPELFGDPAWEMLIDIFIHEGEGNPLPVSSLCVTPSIPMSSALRLCQKLCDAGIIHRIPDPSDGRRSFVSLAPEIAHRIRAYFEEGPG